MHVVQQWCESECVKVKILEDDHPKSSSQLCGASIHIQSKDLKALVLWVTQFVFFPLKKSLDPYHPSSYMEQVFLFFAFPPIYQKLGKLPPPKKSFASGLPNVTEAFMGLGVTLSNFQVQTLDSRHSQKVHAMYHLRCTTCKDDNIFGSCTW